MSYPSPDVPGPPSYSEVSTSGHQTPHSYDQPPPSYEELGLGPVTAVQTDTHAQRKDYRVEYRSGHPHINYGITLQEGRIQSVAPGSTAAQSEVQPGGRILTINGVDHVGHAHSVILKHLTTEYERYSSLTLQLEYSAAGNDYVPPSDNTIAGRESGEQSEYREYTIQYKSGTFDAYYGIILCGRRIKSVCTGTVSSLAGVIAGGRVVKINGVDMRDRDSEVVTQHLRLVYEQHVPLTLLVDYSLPGEYRAYYLCIRIERNFG